jgi:hypothetical protein
MGLRPGLSSAVPAGLDGVTVVLTQSLKPVPFRIYARASCCAAVRTRTFTSTRADNDCQRRRCTQMAIVLGVR